MKKVYTIALTGLLFGSLAAQNLQRGSVTATDIPNTSDAQLNVQLLGAERAVGDTLMYIPLPELFVTNPADQGSFDFQLNDQDGFTAAAALAGTWTTTNWLLFFNNDPGNQYIVPFDQAVHADTAFYLGGTSWHDPAGCCADDWITMGPVTIPATGATFGYRVRTPDQDYRDGYKVYVGSIGVNPTDFAPADEIYHKAENTGVIAEDTVMTYRTHDVPGMFAGTQVYFAIQNESNDMFLIYMDEFLVLEANNLSVDNSEFEGFGLNSISPNPSVDFANISFSLGKASEVTFKVTDLNGRVVANINQGTKDPGLYNYFLDVSEYSSGVYFVSMEAGLYKTTKKLIVAK